MQGLQRKISESKYEKKSCQRKKREREETSSDKLQNIQKKMSSRARKF